MTVGTVRVSLDFECGWGMVQGGGWRACEAAGVYRDLRPALKRFTDLMDELELSFSWSVVGAMIDDPARRDVSHLRGRFASDVRVFLAESEPTTVDGRDLLDVVLAMRTRQSFGTHTYSHLLFSDPEQGPEVFSEDLTRAVRTNAALGLDATRLVFPRNHAGHFKLVRAAGITHVRMTPKNMAEPTRRPGLARRALSAAVRPISPVVETHDPSGLVLHHASELLNWGAGSGTLKRVLIQSRVSRAIARAAAGADVHFWVHPFDLVQTEGLGDAFATLLSQIADHRERGLIRVSAF